MNIQKMLQYILAGFVLLTIFGFQQLTKIKPEELGLHQAKIDDVGLSQLKIQQDAASKGFLSVSGKTAKQNRYNNYISIFSKRDEHGNQTFIRQPVSSEHGIERLTKSIMLDKLDRQLFQKPYAGVLFSSVTQLKDAPFFTARYVQLVTDPAWNRIVYGDYEGWIKAYGNKGVRREDLNRPHGIDRDLFGNIYVADTGNNRIVILKLHGTGESTELKFQAEYGTDELMHPYDVAWDDRGTPFDASDDLIWVVDTGHHRIIGFSINQNMGVKEYSFGKEGKTKGSFFEPKAIAVGRFNGVSNGNLYVADTGNRRLVKLVVDNDISWLKEFNCKAEAQITSIDVDHWGNVYTSDRSYGEIRKFTSELEPLASFHSDGELNDPLNFNIIFGHVYVESEDKHYWAGYDQGFVIEKWSEASGGQRFQLGVALEEFEVSLSEELDEILVSTKLTDHAELDLAIINTVTGNTIRANSFGWMIPGDKEFAWDRRDDIGLQVAPGFYRVQLSAKSSYGDLTALEETSEFYLPLHYWEDSGGDAKNDVHLIQGIRNIVWGELPYQSIVEHSIEVIYRFTELNPSVDYEIKTQFYNESGVALSEMIKVDDSVIVQEFDVPSGIKNLDWTMLPKESYADGEIEIKITETAGAGNAIISQLWLREANYDPANPPVMTETDSQAPKSFSLSQNFPNPFNPSTTIQFAIPEGNNNQVSLKIFNTLGQTIKVLVNDRLSAGNHSVVWNSRDSFGRPVSSGVYFYQLAVGDFVEVKKLILMK